jgi:hypothetical protein
MLVGFALCVAVGLLTLLQNLLNTEGGDDSGEIQHQGPMFQDHSVKQQHR